MSFESDSQTIEEAKKTKLIFGASGATGYAAIIPWALNNVAGTKFDVVRGYKSMASEIVAMERGEIQGIGSLGWDYFPSSKPAWVANKTIRPLYVIRLGRYAKLPDVPSIVELAQNDRDRKVMKLFGGTMEVGYSLMTPPKVPSERLEILRSALAAMVKDPQFVAAAKKRKLEIDPLSGPEVQKIVADLVDAPNDVVDRMRTVIKPPRR